MATITAKAKKDTLKKKKMRKIFHLEIKSESSHNYYGSLSALCSENPNLGISKFTLDRFDFTEPFENATCIIRKSVMKTTGSVEEKKIKNTSTLQQAFT